MESIPSVGYFSKLDEGRAMGLTVLIMLLRAFF